MMQLSPVAYLRDMFLSIMTPGCAFFEHPTILAAGEVPIYYGEPRPGTGGPPPHVIPDCLVAIDVDTQAIWARVGYDPIQNGKPPDFVAEVASYSTRRNDSGHKRDVYRMLGVPEYWRFDPTGGRLYGESIIGEHLVNGQYERFPLLRYDDGSEGSTSPTLDLDFRWRDQRFHVHNPTTGLEYEHPRDELARLREENRLLRSEG